MKIKHLIICSVISFVFFSTAFSGVDEIKTKIMNHAKSGAYLGINMSISKDELTYKTLSQLENISKNYCLKVGDNLASKGLLERLSEVGHLANSCSGEHYFKVEFSNFKEPSPGLYSLYYSYSGYPRSAGGFDCMLEKTHSGKIKLIKCEMQWIS